MAFHIKVRDEFGWHEIARFDDSEKDETLEAYNSAPVPRMLIGRHPETGRGTILHKQYSNNGFIYRGKR